MTKKIEKKTGKGKNGTKATGKGKNGTKATGKGKNGTKDAGNGSLKICALPWERCIAATDGSGWRTVTLTFPPVLMARLMLAAVYDEMTVEKFLVNIVADECQAIEEALDHQAMKEARKAYCDAIAGLIPEESTLRALPVGNWAELRENELARGSKDW
jgi:hypothetical protein